MGGRELFVYLNVCYVKNMILENRQLRSLTYLAIKASIMAIYYLLTTSTIHMHLEKYHVPSYKCQIEKNLSAR